MEYTKQQNAALSMIQNNQVCIMTGSPGTGKTTATLQIIEWAKSENLSVLQASPTGRAAKRMMEATDHYASTIHSMLGCEFDGITNKFTFIHNKHNPLNADLLIIDEISMITTELMADVLEAVDVNRTKVLLIGDKNQLPSVGPGAVLRDLMDCVHIPCIELDIIHRNSGEIVKACHDIKDGKLYTPYAKLNLEADSPINLIHIERQTPEETLSAVEALTCNLVPDKFGYDPVNEIQVISPVNKKGILSCESINNVLKHNLNPVPMPGYSSDNRPKFCKGDKVINTKNDKAVLVNGKSSAIVNGDIGIVQKTSDKHIIVLFSDPDREVSILKSEQHLLHAYCITCHRFQGSEAPVIIIPVHAQFNYFLSNSWIYTAISRAKNICITVGSFNTIQRAIQNRKPNNRVTRLRHRILEKV